MVSKTKKTQILKVQGTHCASCHLIIKQRLLEQKEVKEVCKTKNQNEIQIHYHKDALSLSKINELFQDEGYSFTNTLETNEPSSAILDTKKEKNIHLVKLIFGVILIFIIFNLIERSGITGLIQADSSTPLLVFIPFGLIASLSTCFALVGGLILSISKNSTSIKPHLVFQSGRILTFTLAGGLLGLLGSLINISLGFMAVITIIISILIILLGLQSLGFRPVQLFDTAIFEKILGKSSDKKKSQIPTFLMGAITFLLPCGFTMTAQAASILSKDFVRGALVLFFFSIGTLPVLLAIGLTSAKLYKQTKLKKYIQELIGIIIIFVGLFTINSQLTILGLPNLNSLRKIELFTNNKQIPNYTDDEYPEMADGYQVLKMQASAYGYSPNYFKIKKGIPVRWEIADIGTSGCTNAVIAQDLFDGRINLTRGETSVKEFTPQKAGRYTFSCWMGMISGIIEVVET